MNTIIEELKEGVNLAQKSVDDVVLGIFQSEQAVGISANHLETNRRHVRTDFKLENGFASMWTTLSDKNPLFPGVHEIYPDGLMTFQTTQEMISCGLNENGKVGSLKIKKGNFELHGYFTDGERLKSARIRYEENGCKEQFDGRFDENGNPLFARKRKIAKGIIPIELVSLTQTYHPDGTVNSEVIRSFCFERHLSYQDGKCVGSQNKLNFKSVLKYLAILGGIGFCASAPLKSCSHTNCIPKYLLNVILNVKS